MDRIKIGDALGNEVLAHQLQKQYGEVSGMPAEVMVYRVYNQKPDTKCIDWRVYNYDEQYNDPTRTTIHRPKNPHGLFYTPNQVMVSGPQSPLFPDVRTPLNKALLRKNLIKKIVYTMGCGYFIGVGSCDALSLSDERYAEISAACREICGGDMTKEQVRHVLMIAAKFCCMYHACS